MMRLSTTIEWGSAIYYENMVTLFDSNLNLDNTVAKMKTFLRTSSKSFVVF